ncbi:chemotaxis protein CheW [Haloarcula salina]|uniref:Chemotaxis protein CheW n=1 Tax=Haloarcula salina TaxID=1429914 RepID=A0AA41G116_9EURY|nr:chemotaxis protein CheW [Haloarcula salina]MBV0901559.1 chemotaxis protein CheW [Haloarcula salina]
MSDDERMDRAERIRRMREGNKAETTDDEASTDADDAAAGSDDEATAEPDDVAAADESDDTFTDDSDLLTGDAENATPADAAGDADPAESDDGDESDGTDDAVAAAQRAAEASSQLAGASGDTAVDQPSDDLSVSANPMQGPTGVELPDQELIQEAMESSTAATAEGASRAAALDDEESTQTEELVRVLEFALGEEYYCIDIEYVEEIVKRETVTRVPNTDDYVEGVVDLRGQITTILDPKEMMDIDDEGTQNLIVVFDPDVFEEQGAMGWIVDEVRQVVPVAESDVNTAPVDGEYINGVVDRDDESDFVIWVEPDEVLADATQTESD